VELYQTSLLCNPEQYNHFGFPNEYEIPFIICVSSSSILFQVLLFKIDGLESAIVLILGMACCCVNYFCLKEASPETDVEQRICLQSLYADISSCSFDAVSQK
jgi:hypothetical protein